MRSALAVLSTTTVGLFSFISDGRRVAQRYATMLKPFPNCTVYTDGTELSRSARDELFCTKLRAQRTRRGTAVESCQTGLPATGYTEEWCSEHPSALCWQHKTRSLSP